MTSKTLFKTLADKDPGILEARLGVTLDQVTTVCRQWPIQELALFGSVLREDFGPDSDVDCLVTYAEGTKLRLHDLLDIRDNLEALWGRSVDLVEGGLIENPFLRAEIFGTAKVIYVRQ
jgi:predicted nucleotidyltransferase